jgi:hypothetical protein
VISQISVAWYATTYNPATDRAQAPWADWGAYYRFVQQLVRTALTHNQPVGYWEVQSEPDGMYPKVGRPTVAQTLEQFRVASAAIESVDPNAKILGPSLSAYNERPGPTLDLSTFLDYVAARHLRLDAVSWHEVGARVSPADNPPDPESVVIDVARARRLIAARPGLGHPDIVISEYTSPENHLIPGWNVGWIEAIERAGVSSADRSCWHGPDLTGQWVAECNEGGLDGLFIPNSGLPQALYWVHRAYAGMTGNRVATSSSDGSVSAIATSGGPSVDVLVGRHVTCTPEIRVDCPSTSPKTPAPVDVEVDVTLPWSGGQAFAEVQRIPNLPGVLPAPLPVAYEAAPVAGGVAHVLLSGFVDGDAYQISLSPRLLG